MAVDDMEFGSDGPTLITQPPGYPEERPETEDFDGMLDHIIDELDGRKVLEKARVSKKTMVYALKQQAAMIKKLKTEAARSVCSTWAFIAVLIYKASMHALAQLVIEPNASCICSFIVTCSNFLLLDYRSRRTAEVVETLVNRLAAAEASAVEASRVTSGLDAVLASLNVKLLELDQTTARVAASEEQVAALLADADRRDKRFVEHCERTACTLGVLETRTAAVETTIEALPGEQVLVAVDERSEPQPLNLVIARLEALVAECKSKADAHARALRSQAEQLENKVRYALCVLEEMQWIRHCCW
jgi:hypothetical protein